MKAIICDFCGEAFNEYVFRGIEYQNAMTVLGETNEGHVCSTCWDKMRSVMRSA